MKKVSVTVDWELGKWLVLPPPDKVNTLHENVIVELHDEGHALIVSDGFRLHAARLGIKSWMVEPKKTFTVKAEALRKALQQSPTVDLMDLPRGIEPYNWRRVMPSQWAWKIQAMTRVLDDAIVSLEYPPKPQSWKPTLYKQHLTTYLESHEGRLRLHGSVVVASDIQESSKHVVVPTRKPVEPGLFMAIRSRFLLDALVMAGPVVTLEGTESNKLVKVESGPYMALVVPLRMK